MAVVLAFARKRTLCSIIPTLTGLYLNHAAIPLIQSTRLSQHYFSALKLLTIWKTINYMGFSSVLGHMLVDRSVIAMLIFVLFPNI